MPSVESAVGWAEGIAADPAYGYSQGADRDGASFDCSSLVCRALRAAGFGTPYPSFSTRTMGSWLTSHGWAWHNGTGGVRRGDVLWKSAHTGIAASPSTVVEARINERGTITGGRPGDQTGKEIAVFALSSMAWVGYWRYEGEEEDMTLTDENLDTIAHAVWNYYNKRVNGDKDAYKLLTDTANAVADMPHSVWNYYNRAVNGDDDAYRILYETRAALNDLIERLEAE